MKFYKYKEILGSFPERTVCISIVYLLSILSTFLIYAKIFIRARLLLIPLYTNTEHILVYKFQLLPDGIPRLMLPLYHYFPQMVSLGR